MNCTPLHDESAFRLTFDGRMTSEYSSQIEDQIIDAMRRHRYLEVDLSKVEEIDPCGVRLVDLLKSVAIVVATSPIVEEAANRIHNEKHPPFRAAA